VVGSSRQKPSPHTLSLWQAEPIGVGVGVGVGVGDGEAQLAEQV